MKIKILLFLILLGKSACGATTITDKDFLTFKMPYDSYCKLSVHANLKRSLRESKNENTIKSIELVELQLVTDIAYLDFIINSNRDDTDYAKYVLNKIVFGLREGYIAGGENIKSKELLVHDKKEWYVDLDKIYKNVVIPDNQKLEFEKWYSKYSFKN
jgi:hypothetical protein